MHLAICTLVLVLFSINVEFSVQKKRQLISVRTRMELYERKFGILEAEVFGLNQDLESVWETVNKTRNMNDINASSEGRSSDQNSAKINRKSETTTYTNESITCPPTLVNELNRNAKAIRDTKLATFKRLNKLETDYRSELSKCMNKVSDIERKHRYLLENIDELNNKLSAKDAIDEALEKHMEATMDDVSNVKNKLAILSERYETTVLKQINEMNVLNDKYIELKTEFQSYQKGTSLSLIHLKQTGWKQLGSSLYKLFTIEMTWVDAMQMCKLSSAGDGYLARIHSSNELEVVAGMMREGHFWLGGCQLQKLGDWTWCGIDTKIEGLITSHFSFSTWRRGQPDSQSEMCLQGYRPYNRGAMSYRKSNCYKKLAFMCEIPIQGDIDLGTE